MEPRVNWDTPLGRAEALVDLFLGERLRTADDLPGLKDAVVGSLLDQLDDIGERGREQIDQLRSPSSSRVPDAFLADEQTIEDELQRCAAGIRGALAQIGILSDPTRLERELSLAFAPSARWASMSEASRIGRPSSRAANLEWTLAPVPWVERAELWPPHQAVSMSDERHAGPEVPIPIIDERPYSGWVQIGMFERQATFASRYPAEPARHLFIATGIEAGERPGNSLPLSSNPPNAWVLSAGRLYPELDAQRARNLLAAGGRAMAALADYELQLGSPDPHRGVGLHMNELVPTLELVRALGLRPETPAVRHVLVDDQGLAMVGRNWRSLLIHDGSFTPLEPAIHGSDLILRPDLYEKCLTIVDPGGLRLGMTVGHREYDAEEGDDPE